MARKLRLRAPKERSQSIRLGFQIAFILLNLWIGIRFYLWVRWIERGVSPVSRPAGVEGWLPIAGLMNLKYWIVSGHVPLVHPAAAMLLLAFLLISILLRRAFCSWLCPVGTVSEMLWKLGVRLRVDAILPKWLDVPLRSLKYLLFGFFGYAIVRMPVEAIDEYMRAPFGLMADVRMLNFFRFISSTSLLVIFALALFSLSIPNFWCRYLCPYGAFLSLASLISPAAITRDPRECIDCGKCAKACPSRLPVDVLPRVRSAECNLCMQCVAVCPAAGALDVKFAGRKRMSGWAVAIVISALFLSVVIAARITGHWQQNVSDDILRYILVQR